MDKYYDSIASGYDELHEKEQLCKLEIIEDELLNNNDLQEFIKPDNRLLDVGCGSGISTRFFNIKKRQGIDPSKELISIAISKDPLGSYLICKAENMPFLKKEFDIIISLTAIQNFDDIEKGLEKIRNIGKKFVLTFLKKTEKRKIIEKIIEEKFRVIKKIEEDKDIIYFCE
jgi:ubiquinone/menaquinone biosynthesis C-methylase UbiE